MVPHEGRARLRGVELGEHRGLREARARAAAGEVRYGVEERLDVLPVRRGLEQRWAPPRVLVDALDDVHGLGHHHELAVGVDHLEDRDDLFWGGGADL